MKSPTRTFLIGLTWVALLSFLAPVTAITAQKTPRVFEVGGLVQNINQLPAEKMQAAGLTWIGTYATVGDDRAQDAIKAAKMAGFKIVLTASGDPKDVVKPGYFDTYADFVGGLAASGADAIEVWHNMNMDNNWPTGKINPTLYVQMLAKAFKKIKAANSQTLVISGAPSPTGAENAFGAAKVWNDDHYYTALAAAGATQYLDCVGVHYIEGAVSPTKNSGDPRDNYPTRYFSTMLNRALKPFSGKPACFTMLGYLSFEGIDKAPDYLPWGKTTTAKLQAQWLAEAAGLSAKSGKVRLMIIFNVDYRGDPSSQGYAMIRPDGTCPACDALAKVLPPVKAAAATPASAEAATPALAGTATPASTAAATPGSGS